MNDLRPLLAGLGPNAASDTGTTTAGGGQDPSASGTALRDTAPPLARSSPQPSDNIATPDVGTTERLNTFMQQFAMAAYASGYASGTQTDVSPTTSVNA